MFKTEDGRSKGKIAFCYYILGVSRRGFYKHPMNEDCIWKYRDLVGVIKEITAGTNAMILTGESRDVSGTMSEAFGRGLYSQ